MDKYIDSYKKLKSFDNGYLKVKNFFKNYIIKLNFKNKIDNSNRWVQFPFYHHVFKDENENFISQIMYMKKFGDFISYNDAVEVLKNNLDKKNNYFCLSFDDGFKNNIENVCDFLDKVKIPAIFFLPTTFIDNNRDDSGKIFFNNSLIKIEFLNWIDCKLISKNKLLTTVAFKIKGKKMFCYEGSIFVAGSAIQWLRDNMLFFTNSKETDKLYSQANKNEKIIFIPALTGLGAPHWKPNTRGAIFGLTRNTSKADIVKATLDSLSFQTLDLIESMQKDAKIKITEIRVDGGMINNDNFLRSLSNVTQIKIIKPENVETTSLGAAYLAGLNAGLIRDISDIKQFWKKNKIEKIKISKKNIQKEVSSWKKTIKNLIALNF